MHKNSISGALYGGMIGDALGYPREFYGLAGNLKKVGGDWRNADYHNVFTPTGFYDSKGNSLISDDTQMTLAVGQAVREAFNPGEQYQNPLAYAQTLQRAFVEWYWHPDNDRAPGNACMSACRQLARSQPWQKATDYNAMGCGANMRVAPIAFLPLGLYERSGLSMLSSAITHAHPTAMLSAAMTTEAIYLSAQGHTGMDLGAELSSDMVALSMMDWSDWVGEHWSEQRWAEAFETMYLTLENVRLTLLLGWEGDPCEKLGQGWTAPEAFGTALFTALRWWDEPLDVVKRAAISNGDSDSIASIAGQIRGAAGVSWGDEWVRPLEYSPRYRMSRLISWLESLDK